MAGWTPATRATRTRCAGTPLVPTCWLLPGMMGWCGCGGLVLNVVFVVFSGPSGLWWACRCFLLRLRPRGCDQRWERGADVFRSILGRAARSRSRVTALILSSPIPKWHCHRVQKPRNAAQGGPFQSKRCCAAARLHWRASYTGKKAKIFKPMLQPRAAERPVAAATVANGS